MRRYFDKLETITVEAANDPKYIGRKVSPAPLLDHYSTAQLAELQKLVNEARDATAADSMERRRVELVLRALDYSEHVCAMIANLSDPQTPVSYADEWKRQSGYFSTLMRDPYFGAAQNLTKLSPALKTIERREKRERKN